MIENTTFEKKINKTMKHILFLTFVFFSSLIFSQTNLIPDEQITAGKLILTNDDVISFYRLEYQENDKVTYVNSENLETEFLYLNSIKSIEPSELTTEEASDIEQILNGENEVPSYSTIHYKDKSIELKNPEKGKAVVYFVRTNGSGYLINFRHFDYDKFIGKFAGQGYIRYECEPGEHAFWVGASNSSYITANLEEGKIYVIETIPVMGMAYARVKIEIPNRFNSKKYNKQKKRIFAVLSNERFDKSPSESELANQSDYQKEIERGLRNYKKREEKEQDHLLLSTQYFE